MKLKTAILTRFNLNFGWGTDKNNHNVLNEDWLNDRMSLFEQYCLPSVRAQRGMDGRVLKDFVWEILLDADTPKNICQRLRDDLQGLHAHLHFIPATSMPRFSDLMNGILQSLIADYDALLTFRLDNDDAISVWCLSSLQQHAYLHFKGSPLVLNCLNGYQYHTQVGMCLAVDAARGHFSALVQGPSAHLYDIYAYRHGKIGKFFPLIQIKADSPLWLEVVHGRNMANDLRSAWIWAPIIKNRSLKEYFAIDIQLSNQSAWRFRCLIWCTILKRSCKRLFSHN